MPDRRRMLLIAPLFAGLAACTVGPDFHRPEAALPVRWAAAPAPDAGVGADARWWRAFGDPVLDRLEEAAAAGSHDLELARERLLAARIARGAARANGAPQVGAEIAYGRERIGTAGLGGLVAPLLGVTPTKPLANGYDFDLYRSGISGSWEIDLWGRNRRKVEMADAAVGQAAAAADGARLAVAVAVARTYWQWRGLVGERTLALRAIELDDRALRIATLLRSRGLAAEIDVLNVAAEKRTRQDALQALDDEIGKAARALAVLTGGNPDTPPVDAAAPAVRPSLVPIAAGLPAELARRRPDIVEAEAALHAATAAVGVAEADFYPSVNLSGLFSVDVLRLADFGWDARSTSAGPALSIPIFSGGRLQRQLDLRRSDQRLAATSYRKTVLNAWREVDDALAAIASLDRRLALAAADRDDRSRITAALASRYRGGDVALPALIDAQAAELAAEQAQLRQVTGAAIARVQLHAALGG